MKVLIRVKLALTILVTMLVLTACRVGDERFEMTNYMGDSVRTFEKRANIELLEESNGVYIMKGVMQLIAPHGDIASVTLLKKAGDYTIFGLRIGMDKAEADKKLSNLYDKEISKAINSANNSITYLYTKSNTELYVSYGIDTDTIVEVSYYKLDSDKEDYNESDSLSAGELIAIIGNMRVYYNEAMVYFKSAQENYETEFGSGIWNVDILGNGVTFGDMIKGEIIKQITELKIIGDKAREMGIVLSEDEIADAKAYAREHFHGMTDADIDRYIVTEALLERVYSDNILAEKVFETLTINVDTDVEDEEARQVTIQQILLFSVELDDNGNRVALSKDEKEAALNKMRSLLEQAKETNDFYSLAQANSQADTLELTFGKGQAPKEYSTAFEQAALSLRTGEVSEIISTEYGWHILYCVTDFNEDATIQAKEAVIEKRRSELFMELYAEWTKDYEVVINNDAWYSIPFNK